MTYVTIYGSDDCQSRNLISTIHPDKIWDAIAALHANMIPKTDTSPGTEFQCQSGSATPVDPPVDHTAGVSFWPKCPELDEAIQKAQARQLENLEMPQIGAPFPGNNVCPECSGRGEIQLFTSTVPCKCCGEK